MYLELNSTQFLASQKHNNEPRRCIILNAYTLLEISSVSRIVCGKNRLKQK